MEPLRAAVTGTLSYPPEAKLPRPVPGQHQTILEVVNSSTLTVAQLLAEASERVCALNFASAKHPGGGFLGGARAQEESLCRSSGLYVCIRTNDMYRRHADLGGGFYTNYAIYSPNVPVFKDDEGTLLAQPYLCSFITAPAVNAGAYLKENHSKGEKLQQEMAARINKVLAIAAEQKTEALILGAWGCGVFQNDSGLIASLFHQALGGAFFGVFPRVVFAILDWSDDHHFIGPFQREFGTA
mgnify:CR=1 FL=1